MFQHNEGVPQGCHRNKEAHKICRHRDRVEVVSNRVDEGFTADLVALLTVIEQLFPIGFGCGGRGAGNRLHLAVVRVDQAAICLQLQPGIWALVLINAGVADVGVGKVLKIGADFQLLVVFFFEAPTLVHLQLDL